VSSAISFEKQFRTGSQCVEMFLFCCHFGVKIFLSALRPGQCDSECGAMGVSLGSYADFGWFLTLKSVSEGLGFRVEGLGLRVEGLGFRV